MYIPLLHNKEKFSGRSGFGLLEMVIAVGLLSIVTVGVAQLTTNVIKGTTSASRRSELTGVANLINEILASNTSCTTALGGQAFNPASNSTSNPAAVILNNPVVPNLGAGTAFAAPDNLTVQSLALSTTNAPPSAVPGVANLYFVSLILTAKTVIANQAADQSVKGNVGGSLAPITFPLILSVSANKVTSCWMNPMSSIGLCPAPQVLVGFNPNGTIVCKDPFYGIAAGASMTCLPSAGLAQYLTGVVGGLPQCQPLSFSCGSGQLTGISGSNGLLNAQCGPPAP